MTTISEVIDRARESYATVDVRYVHPTLFVLCVDDSFEGVTDDRRLREFSSKTGISETELQSAAIAGGVSLCLVTGEERNSQYDFVYSSSQGLHWLPLLDHQSLLSVQVPKDMTVRAIHFFGYKGGQARSTVLAMLAKSLANDGFRVLVIDADVEAPTLDVMFEASPDREASTLMGLCGWSTDIDPLAAYSGPNRRGRVDLISCRPRGKRFDMDFASFALRTALDASLLEIAIGKLRTWVCATGDDHRYDVVLFDHRTGVSPSVLPVLTAWPGSMVINVRLDGLSDRMGQLYEILFAHHPQNPGIYVSFSLDPDEKRRASHEHRAASIEGLLTILGDAISKGAGAGGAIDEPQDPTGLGSLWITWYHDRALLVDNCPAPDRLSKDNQDALRQIRESLELGSIPESRIRARESQSHTLSLSGATDSGWFIETQDIARLFQTNTSFSYVFGRKGTGKTRLFREMVARKLAEPLLSAVDFSGGGLQSGSTMAKHALEVFRDDPFQFWWRLFGAALECESTCDADRFTSSLTKWFDQGAQGIPRERVLSGVVEAASRLRHRRVFVIDGVETAVRSALLRDFVESLFSFLLTVQSDPALSGRCAVRLFLRTDLSRTATQNVEQQTSGRSLELRWDVDAIFNFVLARIAATSWFAENFSSTVMKIVDESERIREGRLPAEAYTELLLEIFPSKLRRNNLQTMTFFRGYFSDAVGDDESRAAFYPRLFESFLECIATPTKLRNAYPGRQIEDGKVAQSLVFEAHASASQSFIEEIKQELFVLLDMSDDDARNKNLVDRFIGAFDGLRTPFPIDALVSELSDRISGVDEPRIREAMNRMRDLGIFEERTGYPGEWRAGRLYKSALRMKYFRV